MNEFVIITDSTADLYDQFYAENPTVRLPFALSVDGVEYVGDEYPLMEYYQTLKSGKVIKTSQINQFTATEEFEKVLNEGKDVLYISFSSAMSGSFDNISYVVNGLKIKYPERKIEIVDTLSGGGGEGLLVYMAYKLKMQGKSVDEIIEWIMQNRTKVHHLFIVDDLTNLKNSGRISALKALVGTMMSLKPILEITKAGGVGVLSKALGRKKATLEIIRFFKQYYIKEENDFILIGHTGNEVEAEFVGSKIKEVDPSIDVKYCYINRLVAGNAGYNAIVVYFFGNERLTK